MSTATILDEIVEHKRGEIAAAKKARPEKMLQELLPGAPPVRNFVEALAAASGMGMIAEIKKASPSASVIREDFNPLAIAKIYERNGAHCLSCLTDEKYFQGHLDYLFAIRREVSIPVMRKDFLLDRYQVLEARAAGADCVLLIAECLNDCQLRDLYFYASELGMECLIEIYEPDNLDRVLKLDPPLLGINNRNLKNFDVSLNHTLNLMSRIPPQTLLISESGIQTRQDVQTLEAAGVRGILVGSSLMGSPDIGAKVRELLGKE